ncbi:hypothetical protein F4553_000035 [Allocatelliglobosispora scoriae]|uniref:Uncharacterized protein n=1 Tax=Allocatelliglobosispora scoriae TaxID=643052 RepID=A0A841BHK8_9ACTN|nr:hypothetical protein [Allocatelliglobosispora scoriae]MBB5866656.1 hypothetical protein [Allocatelliglobosispora scoriae]
MTLRVDTARLELLAKQLDDLGEVACLARGYAHRHGDMSWYDRGALHTLMQPHAEVLAVVEGSLTRLDRFFLDSADGMRAAARYYTRTDTAAAERFDRRLPGPVQVGPHEPLIYPTGSLEDPAAALSDPGQLPDDVMHGNIDLAVLAGYLSLTNDLNMIAASVTGVDVLDHVSQLLVGDWQKFGTWAVALTRLADCLDEVDLHLAADARQTHAGWEGTAGDAAAVYFAHAGTAIRAQAATLRDLAAAYRGISFATNLAQRQLNGLIGSLVDRLIIIGIASAAGTALIETGVGAVAGYSIAALQVIAFLEDWALAAAIIQTAVGVITGAAPELLSLTRTLAYAPSTELPTTPYQHPATRS